jgi:methionyl-tRNA formyltransferase
VRLVFAGTPEVALPSLEAVAASGHDLVAVLTRPDAPSGRGRRLVRSPVGAWADEHGLEVLTPQRPRDPDFLGRLAEIAPDCVPVVAYGALVPPAALVIPRYGWINLHFSLLPAWRGAAPVQHAILHGDDVTGAAVFQLEAGLDTGPVYGSLTEKIGPRDTSGDLLARLAKAGSGLLVAVLDAIAGGTARAVPQPTDGVSLAPKITVADAEVRWPEPALAIDRRVRACTPVPGAWTTYHGERIKLGPVLIAPDLPRLAPGELRVEKSRIVAGTRTEPVVLGEVRPPGRKAMRAADWARGARVATGDRLGGGGPGGGGPGSGGPGGGGPGSVEPEPRG